MVEKMVLKKGIVIIFLLIALLSTIVLAENQTNETKVLIDQCVIDGGEWFYWDEINNTLGEGYCELPEEINEELEASVSLCIQKGGEPVNINRVFYCREGEKYTPLFSLLDQEEEIVILGMKMPDFGSMVFKINPGVGWMIILGALVVIIVIYNDYRTVTVERGTKRARKKRIEKKRKELSEPAPGKRRRSDGGFY